MAKDTFYFSHDYNARTDDKIKRLIRKHGLLGYGVYWAIIEDLYQNANALPMDCEGIAFDLRTDCNLIKSVINDFDLFIIDAGFFGSLSVQKRLTDRNEKSNKARETAFKRWNKDAKALPTHDKRNAIKERKEKELKERKERFVEKLAAFKERYTSKMLNSFYSYWTEHSENGFKMRYEKEKVFDIERRLGTWFERETSTHKKESEKTVVYKPLGPYGE